MLKNTHKSRTAPPGTVVPLPGPPQAQRDRIRPRCLLARAREAHRDVQCDFYVNQTQTGR